ncbi:hypothetical protein TRVL_06857 [Trypanosoma vivax]|nr:hypothetical protein TRVL_06857 [Trypanosoma vivax]
MRSVGSIFDPTESCGAEHLRFGLISLLRHHSIVHTVHKPHIFFTIVVWPRPSRVTSTETGKGSVRFCITCDLTRIRCTPPRQHQTLTYIQHQHLQCENVSPHCID